LLLVANTHCALLHMMSRFVVVLSVLFCIYTYYPCFARDLIARA
jgi:hypothetical protein